MHFFHEKGEECAHFFFSYAPKFLVAFVVLIVIFFSLFRCFFDAELTDEAYSVAEPYLVARGGLPFVNNWSQMPGFSLLIAPFTWLFLKISGGTTGIFLFTRILAQVIRLLSMIIVYKILTKYISDKQAVLLYVLPAFMVTGTFLPAFRGDGLSILLVFIGSSLLASGFMDSKWSQCQFFMAGLVYALSVMCYPTLVIQYMYLLVLILVIGKKREHGKFQWIGFFLLGSGIAATICIGYLVMKSSFSELIKGIGYLLKDVMYFQIENEVGAKIISYVKEIAKQCIVIFLMFALALGLSFCYNLVLFRIGKGRFSRTGDKLACSTKSLKQLSLVSLTFGMILYILYQVKRFGFTDNSNISKYVTTGAFISAPFFLVYIKRNRKLANFLFLTLWVPNWIWVIVTGISAYSSMWLRNALLLPASFLSILYAILAFSDVYQDEAKSFPHLLAITLAAAYCFSNVFNAFSYIYRDGSLLTLTRQVETGPYKWIYTTPERAEGLLETDNIINENISEDDTILAMDNDPFIYLMTDANLCTPCTWDQALYSYGFDNPELYYDYFEITRKEPSKIIYLDFGRDAIMSIDTDYKFNGYVSAYYRLIYENRNIKYPTLIFERKN